MDGATECPSVGPCLPDSGNPGPKHKPSPSHPFVSKISKIFFFGSWFDVPKARNCLVRVSNKSAETKVSWTNCCSSWKTCCLRYLTKDAERSLLHATSLWTIVYPPKRKVWSKLGSRLAVGFLVAPENGMGERTFILSILQGKTASCSVDISAKPCWERSGATFTASSARGWDDCSCQ